MTRALPPGTFDPITSADTGGNVFDGVVVPAIGTSAMIVAYYTPIFDWIGVVFYPLIAMVLAALAVHIFF